MDRRSATRVNDPHQQKQILLVGGLLSLALTIRRRVSNQPIIVRTYTNKKNIATYLLASATQQAITIGPTDRPKIGASDCLLFFGLLEIKMDRF